MTCKRRPKSCLANWSKQVFESHLHTCGQTCKAAVFFDKLGSSTKAKQTWLNGYVLESLSSILYNLIWKDGIQITFFIIYGRIISAANNHLKHMPPTYQFINKKEYPLIKYSTDF